MFGCLAIYLHGRIVLLLSEGEEPWNGLLIPTEHEHHKSIVNEFNYIVQHPVLKKWLYLPGNIEDFESVASEIVHAIEMNDPRFGVEPKERKPRKSRKRTPDSLLRQSLQNLRNFYYPMLLVNLTPSSKAFSESLFSLTRKVLADFRLNSDCPVFQAKGYFLSQVCSLSCSTMV